MDGLLQDDLFGIITVGFAELLAEALHQAVISDDVEALDRLLREPSSDINCLKFGDNLLVTAIKHERTSAAIWLVKNGVDCDYETCHVVMHEVPADHSQPDVSDRKFSRQGTKAILENASKRAPSQQSQPLRQQPDLYSITCRQLAYEKQLWEIVAAIDAAKGNFSKASRRYPDMRHYSRLRSARGAVRRTSIDFEDGEGASKERGAADDFDETRGHGDAEKSDGAGRRQRPPDTGYPSALPPNPLSRGVTENKVNGNDRLPTFRARGDFYLFDRPSVLDVLKHCQLCEDERTSSPTILWRRSTLTKSAKQRQRHEQSMAVVSARLTPAAGDAEPALNKAMSRLLAAASATAQRQHSAARKKSDGAFSHPSVMRARSSKRTKQSSAA